MRFVLCFAIIMEGIINTGICISIDIVWMPLFTALQNQQHFDSISGKELKSMKAVGLIVEYNPFHNGHLFHMEEAKKLANADYVVCVMSGNFVQRGAPAIVDKYTRTQMALACGADLVIELPAAFATGSAEDFAAAAIRLLDGLGAVDSLCFGSERGELTPFVQAARILAEEPLEYQTYLRSGLKEGLSYPAARSRALAQYAAAGHFCLDENLLDSPNNILGLEYLKALYRQESTMRPLTIKRHVSSYHSQSLEGIFSSASAIRKGLETGTEGIREQMPDPAYELLSRCRYLEADDFSQLLSYRLLSLLHDGRDLADFADVSPELASRLKKNGCFGTWPQLAMALKTKQYTYTRISRALLHILLDIKSCDMDSWKREGYVKYARVLGFCRRAVPLMSEIKRAGSLPLLTKTAGFADPLFQNEVLASDIYRNAYFYKYGQTLKDEFTRGLVIAD